ncbi:MAG: SRPBCC family protein [Verrucomicrobiota bacterium]
MTPITFACHATLSMTPEQVVEQIMDVTKWPEFQGYGPIPGIKSAVFETRPPEIIGSRIRVTNLDGSTHVEEIVEWMPNKHLSLRMSDFSPPLSRLAAGFLEVWQFQPGVNETQVIRSFEIHAKSIATKPILWLISFLLKRAITRNLDQMTRVKIGSSQN